MVVGRGWVCLSLGSNMGDRHTNLAHAVAALSSDVIIEARSSIYETDPVGYVDQPSFLNAVLLGRTGLSPHDLLALVKSIERDAGRLPSLRNAPRPLDIDILLYGFGEGSLFVMRSPNLVVPHPRMHERAFVLVPLAEIAPDTVHPALDRTVADLRREVGDAGVKKWGDWQTDGGTSA